MWPGQSGKWRTGSLGVARENKMFRITGDKGFHITFSNGWTVSVQWGPASQSAKDGHTAGVAAWYGNEAIEQKNTAIWQTPEQVAAFIAKIAKKKGE